MGVARVEMWMSPDSLESYEFATNFRVTLAGLKKSASFTPKYKFRNLQDQFEEKKLREMCYAKGKFCAPEFEKIADDPKSILMEGVRQICIWNLDESHGKTLWWDYVEQYKVCLHKKLSGLYTPAVDCYEQIDRNGFEDKMSHQKLRECISSSFTDESDVFYSQNTLLNQHQNPYEFQSVYLMPVALVEGKLVKGDLTSVVVLSAICEVLFTKPEICEVIPILAKFATGTPGLFSRLDPAAIIALCVLGLLILALFFVVVRNLETRRINQEIAGDIRTHVSEYLRLKETETGPKDKE